MIQPRALRSLRTLLFADAATCVASGVLLVAASAMLAALTGLPEPLLFWAGAVLFPVAAFMAAVVIVVAGNLSWIAASLLLPVLGLVAPNALGLALLVGQALGVAGLTWLEYAALRGAPPAVGRA